MRCCLSQQSKTARRVRGEITALVFTLPRMRPRLLLCCSICLVAFFESVVYGFSFPYFSLRLEQQGLSVSLIGLHAAIGTLGVLLCGRLFPRVIGRCGYQRSTAVAFGSSVLVLLGLLANDSVALSFVLRLLLGMSFAGVWVCTEAWINDVVPDEHRGKVNAGFQALYSLGFFLGPAATYLTGFAGAAPVLFMLAMMGTGLLVLACMRDPVSAASAVHGGSSRALLARARGILFVSLLIGLCETAIFALLPVYGVRQGLTTDLAVSLLLAYSAGEILIALPIGWLADRLSRARLLIACALAAASAVFLLLTVTESRAYAWSVAALAGGLVVSLHNIALIMLGERFRGAELPIVSTAFSMTYALGSAGGAAVGGAAMALLGPAGLPLFVGSSLLLFGGWLAWARRA
jgi:MFS family permease